ncbi:uncharacterized protein LOC121376440 [Gigantopelta aegis]|uniref:uncharacterized protein LOC121376440 n=1 Tax=Gigantopelta aegis TaxID=1735272 RepID=UPI001B887CF0|nr:uncharacterized protein LOC121376440 [Gigantopelta aegis]
MTTATRRQKLNQGSLRAPGNKENLRKSLNSVFTATAPPVMYAELHGRSVRDLQSGPYFIFPRSVADTTQTVCECVHVKIVFCLRRSLSRYNSAIYMRNNDTPPQL